MQYTDPRKLWSTSARGLWSIVAPGLWSTVFRMQYCTPAHKTWSTAARMRSQTRTQCGSPGEEHTHHAQQGAGAGEPGQTPGAVLQLPSCLLGQGRSRNVAVALLLVSVLAPQLL